MHTVFVLVLISRVNINVGALEERMMVSGQHTVADIFCCFCGQIVGWKYVISLSLSLTRARTHTHMRACTYSHTAYTNIFWTNFSLGWVRGLAASSCTYQLNPIFFAIFHACCTFYPCFASQEAAHEKSQKFKEGKFVLER